MTASADSTTSRVAVNARSRFSPGIRMPQLPQVPSPRPFPLIATITPIIGSLVLWAVMRSPYVLVFALLGPLLAIASLGDSALQARRTRTKERKRFAVELEQAYEAIAREHSREVSALSAEHRDFHALTTASRRDPERWRGSPDTPLIVVAGAGCLHSALELEATSSLPAVGLLGDLEGELASLRSVAEVLAGAPVLVDARQGIGVCGPPVIAAACARGVVLQLADALSPGDFRIVVTGGADTDWLINLPHEVAVLPAAAEPVLSIEFRRRSASGLPDSGSERHLGGSLPDGPVAVVALASTVEALPRQCRIVLVVDGVSAARLLPSPHGLVDAVIAPELVSIEQACGFTQFLAEAAEAAGFVRGVDALPESVAFEDLYPEAELASELSRVHEVRRDSLACTPVWGALGPVLLDLVIDGPHAVVGGTTGSGKSEFLVSWVLAMAAQFGPDAVTFLLVDFKGGASFAAVQDLPHSVGLITDLDHRAAHRALTSLQAELRYRERALADAGVRSIEQLSDQHPLPRLVIVVDEFAAMVQDFPELHALFADLASRGRSLGVHLILCTQRPAGVVRDAVLANCTLRVSLRVNNRADSTAVIGSAAAAELPRHPLGRALLCLSGGEPQAVQVALAKAADSERVARKWHAAPGGQITGSKTGIETISGGSFLPRRPWCDPLPAIVRLEELDPGDGGLVFGLSDIPREQRQPPAVYQPATQGSLLVIGAHRSGKSGVLAALAAADGRGLVEMVPCDQQGAWDAIAGRLAAIRAGDAPHGVVLIDDIDVLLGSYPEEYAHAFNELVTALLREGGRAGTQLVITACRLGSQLQALATLCDSRLVLRLPDKQEHMLAGGNPANFDPELPPGGGYWHGDRVQVGLAAFEQNVTPAAADISPQWSQWSGWAVVAARPGEVARVLTTEQGGDPALPRGWELVELDARSSPPVLPVLPSNPEAGGLGVGSVARGTVIIADAETWRSQWGLIGAVKATMPILFVGCSTSEFRAISTLRQLPPPISPGSDAVWMLTPNGVVSRVRPPWSAMA